jgi:citrate synthase
MKLNMLTATQAATRLGVRTQTVYAYVSRGVLSRVVSEDGRTSLFDVAEVERLARRGRPRSDRARIGTVDVSLATSITEIHADRLLFRGHDAAVLARTSSFEAVAELLWTGSPGQASRWAGPPSAVRVARAAAAALPPGTSATDRLAVVTAALAGMHPLRGDLRPAVVLTHARALVATFVEVLPPVTAAPRRRSDGQSIAWKLWRRLSPLAPSPERVAILDTALVLLADHELATSTLAVRVAASTRADPFDVVLAGLGAVAGRLHGRAPRAVHELLLHAAASSPEIAVAGALDATAGVHGFGHPVYRGTDPRAACLLAAIAPTLSRAQRKLIDDVIRAATGQGAVSPNVDFALGVLAFVTEMPVGATEAIFAISRTPGWIAHALEEYGEAPLRFRARAVYIGESARSA